MNAAPILAAAALAALHPVHLPEPRLTIAAGRIEIVFGEGMTAVARALGLSYVAEALDADIGPHPEAAWRCEVAAWRYVVGAWQGFPVEARAEISRADQDALNRMADEMVEDMARTAIAMAQ